MKEQEKKREKQERKEEKTEKTRKKTEEKNIEEMKTTKRKRECQKMTDRQTDNSSSNFDVTANTATTTKISHNIHPSERDVTHIPMSSKQSKLAQKPQFKVKRKANLWLCHQQNKISDYFSANIGRGISGVESEIKLSDFNSQFSSARTKRQPGPT